METGGCCATRCVRAGEGCTGMVTQGRGMEVAVSVAVARSMMGARPSLRLAGMLGIISWEEGRGRGRGRGC